MAGISHRLTLISNAVTLLGQTQDPFSLPDLPFNTLSETNDVHVDHVSVGDGLSPLLVPKRAWLGPIQRNRRIIRVHEDVVFVLSTNFVHISSGLDHLSDHVVP